MPKPSETAQFQQWYQLYVEGSRAIEQCILHKNNKLELHEELSHESEKMKSARAEEAEQASGAFQNYIRITLPGKIKQLEKLARSIKLALDFHSQLVTFDPTVNYKTDIDEKIGESLKSGNDKPLTGYIAFLEEKLRPFSLRASARDHIDALSDEKTRKEYSARLDTISKDDSHSLDALNDELQAELKKKILTELEASSHQVERPPPKFILKKPGISTTSEIKKELKFDKSPGIAYIENRKSYDDRQLKEGARYVYYDENGEGNDRFYDSSQDPDLPLRPEPGGEDKQFTDFDRDRIVKQGEKIIRDLKIDSDVRSNFSATLADMSANVQTVMVLKGQGERTEEDVEAAFYSLEMFVREIGRKNPFKELNLDTLFEEAKKKNKELKKLKSDKDSYDKKKSQINAFDKFKDESRKLQAIQGFIKKLDEKILKYKPQDETEKKSEPVKQKPSFSKRLGFG